MSSLIIVKQTTKMFLKNVGDVGIEPMTVYFWVKNITVAPRSRMVEVVY